MNKIISITQIKELAEELHKQNKQLILTGGFFDILHVGHIHLLEKAKAHGDILIVLLEGDESARKIKGKERPINPQPDRALVLSAIEAVDYVVLLPPLTHNEQYDTLVKDIKPAIIATTTGDPYRGHKERQANLIGGKVVDVVELMPVSTTELAKRITQEML